MLFAHTVFARLPTERVLNGFTCFQRSLTQHLLLGNLPVGLTYGIRGRSDLRLCTARSKEQQDDEEGAEENVGHGSREWILLRLSETRVYLKGG
jgi:hypothetical protein